MAIEKVGDNFNTMLAYSGHGMVEHHPANLTVAGVMGHELGHVNFARNRALMTGEKIVSQNIELKFRMVDGRLIAESGLATTVVAKEQPNYGRYKIFDRFAKADEKKRPDDRAANAKPSAPDRRLSKELEDRTAQVSRKLEEHKGRIEQKISRLELELKVKSSEAEAVARQTEFEASGAVQVVMADGRSPELEKSSIEDSIRRLKNQMSKIENMISSVEVAKNIDMVGKLIQSVADTSIATGLNLASAAAKAQVAAAETSPDFTAATREILQSFETPAALQGEKKGAALGGAANATPGDAQSAAFEAFIRTIESALTGALVDITA